MAPPSLIGVGTAIVATVDNTDKIIGAFILSAGAFVSGCQFKSWLDNLFDGIVGVLKNTKKSHNNIGGI